MPRIPFGNPANDPVPDGSDLEAIINADDPATVGDPAPPVAEAPADPVSDQPPVADTPVPIATSDGRFNLGTWGGIAQYQCAGVARNGRPCKFDTLDEREFNEHWQKVHAGPGSQPSGLIGLDGQPL